MPQDFTIFLVDHLEHPVYGPAKQKPRISSEMTTRGRRELTSCPLDFARLQIYRLHQTPFTLILNVWIFLPSPAGKIINTASIGGLLAGGTYLAPYQGTKHAVVAITESLHAELALESAPITAACLCPGDTATGIWESDRLRPSEEHNQLLSDAEQQMHEAVAGMCANGLSPAQVATAAFDAIEKDQFWIFPQDQFKPMLELRIEAILKEQQPPSADQLLAIMLNNGL